MDQQETERLHTRAQANRDQLRAKTLNDAGASKAEAKRYDAALEDFEKSLTLHPDQHTAASNRAHALIALQRFNEGIQAYRDIVERNPTADTHSDLGWALCLNKDLDAAMEQLDQALEIDPNHMPALYNRATILMFTGEEETAASDLEAILGQNPEYRDAAEKLQRCLQTVDSPR